MNVRRTVAVFAAALAATLGLVGPASATGPTYPPSTSTGTKVLLPGLTFGGPQTGKMGTPITVPEPPSTTATVAGQSATRPAGTRLMMILQGSPNDKVTVSVTGSCKNQAKAGPVTIGTFPADAVLGPFTFSTPSCTYVFTFEWTVNAVSLGATGSRVPAAAVGAAATVTSQLTVTIPASSTALPKTGGPGLGIVWAGVVLLLLGIAAVLAATRRRTRQH